MYDNILSKYVNAANISILHFFKFEIYYSLKLISKMAQHARSKWHETCSKITLGKNFIAATVCNLTIPASIATLAQCQPLRWANVVSPTLGQRGFVNWPNGCTPTLAQRCANIGPTLAH